jgi:hypothetical protein
MRVNPNNEERINPFVIVKNHKNTKKSKNFKNVFSSSHEHSSSYLETKPKCGPKDMVLKKPFRMKICRKKPPDKQADKQNYLKFPYQGTNHDALNKLRNMSSIQKDKRRAHLLSLTRQAKKDKELLLILQKAIAGTLLCTSWFWNFSEPYIAVHQGGFLYYRKTPGLVRLDALINQLIRCESTYLVKYDSIVASYDHLVMTRLIANYCILESSTPTGPF